MRTNLENLVAVARQHGKATASSWRAWGNEEDGVYVFHYSTLMFTVSDDNKVTPVSCGWQSMTDKHGVRKILRNVSGQGYAEVFPREWTDKEYADVLRIHAIKARQAGGFCQNCEAHTGWFVEEYDNGTEYACDTCEEMWIEETDFC